jgi:hypothetical protein
MFKARLVDPTTAKNLWVGSGEVSAGGQLFVGNGSSASSSVSAILDDLRARKIIGGHLSFHTSPWKKLDNDMRYWWINQNQTYRHEVAGGYLRSPKRNANGARNPFYESMREVAPGDLIFSFMDTRILVLGIAQLYCWESPKPLAFGNSGQNWEGIGWRVKVYFTELANKVRPKDHIDILRSLLPDKYSPLQLNGNGLQSPRFRPRLPKC